MPTEHGLGAALLLGRHGFAGQSFLLPLEPLDGRVQLPASYSFYLGASLSLYFA